MTPQRLQQVLAHMRENSEGKDLGTLDFEGMHIWVCFQCGEHGAHERLAPAVEGAFMHNWIWCKKGEAAS